MKHTKSENQYIEEYKKKGYKDDYIFKNKKLVNTRTNKEYDAKNISIVAEHRFEGMTNPSDMSILYILKMHDESKGNMLVGYGPSANLELAEFFMKVSEA